MQSEYEQSYLAKIKRYIYFHGKPPDRFWRTEYRGVSDASRLERNVSTSIQNQAKSALPFLYSEVLKIKLPWLNNVAQVQ
jgi:hypothetical protein